METIAVWFSCGAASAVAAKRTIEIFGDIADIRILNNEIKEEDEDNRRFLIDVQDWLGIEIEDVFNPKYPSKSIEDVFEKRKYMSGVAGAPCTLELKKKPDTIGKEQTKLTGMCLASRWKKNQGMIILFCQKKKM